MFRVDLLLRDRLSNPGVLAMLLRLVQPALDVGVRRPGAGQSSKDLLGSGADRPLQRVPLRRRRVRPLPGVEQQCRVSGFGRCRFRDVLRCPSRLNARHAVTPDCRPQPRERLAVFADRPLQPTQISDPRGDPQISRGLVPRLDGRIERAPSLHDAGFGLDHPPAQGGHGSCGSHRFREGRPDRLVRGRRLHLSSRHFSATSHGLGGRVDPGQLLVRAGYLRLQLAQTPAAGALARALPDVRGRRLAPGPVQRPDLPPAVDVDPDMTGAGTGADVPQHRGNHGIAHLGRPRVVAVDRRDEPCAEVGPGFGLGAPPGDDDGVVVARRQQGDAGRR